MVLHAVKSRADLLSESLAEHAEREKTESGKLDDATRQQQIMEPEPKAISIGGEERRIYPMAAKSVRRFVGLAQLITDSARGEGVPFNRFAGVIAESYSGRLIPFIAESLFPSPDKLDLATYNEFCKEIDDKTSEPPARGVVELVTAFLVMLDLNGAMEFFFPKPKPTPEKPETSSATSRS